MCRLRFIIMRLLKVKSIDHFLFVATTLASAGIHFIYSIIIKAYVMPLEFGMYSTCMILQTYLSYLQLGSLNAFNRDYPQLIGARKYEEAQTYRITVFSFLLLVYLLAIFICSIIFIIIGTFDFIDKRILFGFMIVTVITGLMMIENFGNYRCRIDNGFMIPSIITLFELLSIPIGLILLSKIGYYALYITSLASVTIGIVLYYRISYNDLKFSVNFGGLRTILLSGFPLLINSLIWTVVNSIDKFVILGFINTEALGIYGIAQNAFSYMVLIPSAMSQLFYVKIGKFFGETKDQEKLILISNRYSTILSAITSFIAIIAFYMLPFMVNKFMPNYNEGILSSQILILGLTIYSATLINGNVLTILKKNKALLLNSLLVCVCNIVCSIFLVCVIGSKIESVAIGTAVSYILCALILIVQVNKYVNNNCIELLKSSVFPIIFTIIPSAIFYNFIANKIIGLTVSILLFVLVYKFFIGKILKFEDNS